jgi:oxygen-dependent protoporphyrinogen oxidase
MMIQKVRQVAVLGGGITGLSAAFYLLKLAREQGESVEVTVLEGSDRLGGRIHTLHRDGFVIERGPDSFLARKLPMIDLAKELGLEDELTGTNPTAKKTYISLDGKLHPMPEGLTLGIPTNIEKFLKTELVSEEGKQRALEDLEIPPGDLDGDINVGDFLERRMGREMVERIFEPLLAGIHAGDLYRLGLEATFPQFKAFVREHGSLIRGMAENQRIVQENAAVKDAAVKASTTSVFMTYRRGLSSIIEALQERLIAEGCHIRMGAQVNRLEKVPGGDPSSLGGYKLHLSDDRVIEADSILCTLPAYAAAPLFKPYLDVTALTDIRYVSVANIVLAYDDAGFGHPLEGSGFLVPRGEGRHITASTWTSSKWLHTAPKGKRLIRCYVGRSGDERFLELSNKELAAAVRHDLQELMGISAIPEFVEITRLRHSMPQYPVGHIEAIANLRRNVVNQLPSAQITGAAFGGVGLPDCVAQGKAAAQALLALN